LVANKLHHNVSLQQKTIDIENIKGLGKEHAENRPVYGLRRHVAPPKPATATLDVGGPSAWPLLPPAQPNHIGFYFHSSADVRLGRPTLVTFLSFRRRQIGLTRHGGRRQIKAADAYAASLTAQVQQPADLGRSFRRQRHETYRQIKKLQSASVEWPENNAKITHTN